MVDVSSQNNSVSINVSSGGNSASIKATPDTAQYYSEKSREWAISNRIVDNTDYSSKYYAEKSKESETNSSNYERSVVEKYNSFVEVSNQAEIELQTLKDDSISQINTVTNSGISEIANKTSEVITEINANKETATNEINNVKNNAVTQLSKEAEEQLKNIESTGFYMRDDKLYFINSEGEEEKFVSGGGLEIGDIGIAPLGIDETQNKRRYLNGQIIIQEQFVSFTEKLKNAIALYPSLACSEDEWQTKATMTVSGEVGKFVVEDEGGTIRLPRIIMPIRGLTNLSQLANIVEAGLPNITGSINGTASGGMPIWTEKGSGALYNNYKAKSFTAYPAVTENITRSSDGTLRFDASRSSSIYGKSATVRPEAIQYPYFIQVATGTEESIDTTRAVEINNPFFLGMSQYFESTPNNPSWLKSEGQYNYKAVYPDYYDWLLKIYNGTETQEGVSVKLSTEAYTDYDFVINQTDETFRLPLLNGSETIPNYDATQTWSTVTNGTSLDLPCNGFFRTRCQGATYVNINQLPVVYALVGDSTPSVALNLTTGLLKKGEATPFFDGTMTDLVFIPACGNGALYYYVGEGIVNPQLVNVARIEEKLVETLAKPHIIETSDENLMPSWYRIYSNGLCEQGGIANVTNGTRGYTVTLLKSYKNINFIPTVSANNNAYGTYGYGVTVLSSSQIFLTCSNDATRICVWSTSGYIA